MQAELRAKFDEHKDEKDLVKAKKILEEAENHFEETKHPQPLICMLHFCYYFSMSHFLIEITQGHTHTTILWLSGFCLGQPG